MKNNIFLKDNWWQHLSSVSALCTILILLLIHNNASCEPVPFEKAKEIAANWMIILEPDSKTVINGQNTRSVDVTSSNKAAPKIYVVNFNPSGYVLLSSDTIAKPIIAYSTSDSFSWETLPPGFS